MALVDYIPVGLFLASAILLQRDLYNKMSKGAFALFSAGTITVFVAGFFKATWKLLYALSVCDFVALNKCFFPMQTTGFVLAAAGLLAFLFHKQGAHTVYAAAAPLVYDSNMLFVILMVLGVLAVDGSMLMIARKRRQTLASVLYIVSFVFIMGMGYLSSRDFTQPAMNWLGEAVNIIGQGSFFWATLILHRNGLDKADSLCSATGVS